LQLAVHVRQLQPVSDPPRDLALDRQQPLPRLPVPAGTCRADRVDHLPEQLIGELLEAGASHHPGGDCRLDVTTRSLAVDTGPLSDRPLTQLATDPMPQNLSYFVHPNLPEGHSRPPDRTT
jgi:hypothetical protein